MGKPRGRYGREHMSQFQWNCGIVNASKWRHDARQMLWQGRRESENVEDVRGSDSGRRLAVGGGIGGVKGLGRSVSGVESGGCRARTGKARGAGLHIELSRSMRYRRDRFSQTRSLLFTARYSLER